jgi:Ion transport protein
MDERAPTTLRKRRGGAPRVGTMSAAAAGDDAVVADESTPLVLHSAAPVSPTSSLWRYDLYDFLEGKTVGGRRYEKLVIVLIVLNVWAFIFATTCVEGGKQDDSAFCGPIMDTLLFGNNAQNGWEFLGIGSTSLLELVTVLVFSVEYLARFTFVLDLEDPVRYAGFLGRLRYITTFYSLVDLVSTVPFYIDAFLIPNSDIQASTFFRMFRLLRMMKGVEGRQGRFNSAITLLDDVILQQLPILGTALFVGVTIWIVIGRYCMRKTTHVERLLSLPLFRL